MSDSSFENDVVRAWSTFVDRIEGVARATASPGEIQRAAIDAGDPPDAVRTLTQTFNDVRYGEVDPARHRAAASAALRTLAEQEAANAESSTDDEMPPEESDAEPADDPDREEEDQK